MLKMFTVQKLTNDEAPIEGREVRFVDDQGREAFSVRIGKDGRSLEVRGVDTIKVDGKLYGSTLQAVPRASNALTIEAREHDLN